MKHFLLQTVNKNSDLNTWELDCPAAGGKTGRGIWGEYSINTWFLSDQCVSICLPSLSSCLCLRHAFIATAWLSSYQIPAKIYSLLSFHINITTYFSLYVKLPLFLLYLLPSLPLRTSEDESGNRDREVLGQSLGAAGRMHWTVVGGAASVGKGRPGSVST